MSGLPLWFILGPMSFAHLNQHQRYQIEKQLAEGKSVAVIARSLGIHRSTVYRIASPAARQHCTNAPCREKTRPRSRGGPASASGPRTCSNVSTPGTGKATPSWGDHASTAWSRWLSARASTPGYRPPSPSYPSLSPSTLRAPSRTVPHAHWTGRGRRRLSRQAGQGSAHATRTPTD
ncbi:MAG: helix-turn-helix domain-containing protein [Uliginosibacterium sp.]|nr:helix-turn-helix domain-containing protein [Uliginosibacterium sp.]